MRKKVIISVTNDLCTDQRVHKVCLSLQSIGFEVILWGRALSYSKGLSRTYSTKRMRLIFSSGPFFYIEYNLRLFFILLFSKCHLLLANDLDTLLANFLASKCKGVPLVYDSHELFPESPELLKSPFKKFVWECLEALLLPKIKHSYTVCHSIAQFYKKKYGIEMKVVRNFPYLNTKIHVDQSKNTIIYQGSLNPGRGLDLAIQSMKYLPEFNLKIIGGGLELSKLKHLAKVEGVSHQVHFLGRLPFEELSPYTKEATVGLLLEEPLGLSFEYSLPNKLFDYIHANTPVLASPLIEVKSVMKKYPVGVMLKERNPKSVANQLKEIVSNLSHYDFKKAKSVFNWHLEEKVIHNIFIPFLE